MIKFEPEWGNSNLLELPQSLLRKAIVGVCTSNPDLELDITKDSDKCLLVAWLVINSKEAILLDKNFIEVLNDVVQFEHCELTILQYSIWVLRPDLRAVFDLSLDSGSRQYLSWLKFNGCKELSDIETLCPDTNEKSENSFFIGEIPCPPIQLLEFSEDMLNDRLLEADIECINADTKALVVIHWLLSVKESIELDPRYIDFFQSPVRKESVIDAGLTNLEYYFWLLQSSLCELFDLTTFTGMGAYLKWLGFHGEQMLPSLQLITPIDSKPDEETENSLPELPQSLKAAAVCGLKASMPDISLDFDDARTKGLVVTWWAMNVKKPVGLAPIFLNYLSSSAATYGECWAEFSKVDSFIWHIRKDLQLLYDIQTLKGRIGYFRWLKHTKSRELGDLNTLCLAPVVVKKELQQLGVNIIGMVNAELGIGEDVRMLALCLEQAGIEYCIYNYPEQTFSRQNDGQFLHKVVPELQYKINIFCLPAIEVVRAYFQLGELFFDGYYNIGYWPWELPYWPKEFEQAFNYTNEIWCSSNFIASSVSPATNLPVRVMPMAVVVDQEISANREEFGISPEDFTFLYIFDSLSFPQRKNPLAAIRAFKAAFPIQVNCKLIIKVMHFERVSSKIKEDILSSIDGDNRIQIVDEVFDKSKLYRLYKSVDAYISLHRSEGYGRTIPEAMLFNLPVIVSNYSGNTDYCSQDNSYLVGGSLIPVGDEYQYSDDRQVWFDADIESAVEALRSCYLRQSERVSKIGVAASLSANFSPLQVSKHYKHRLCQLFLELAKKDGGVDLLSSTPDVKLDYFQSPFEPVLKTMTRNENIAHYQKLLNHDTYYPRKLFPGFHPLDYQKQNDTQGLDPSAHYLISGKPEGSWKCPLISPSSSDYEGCDLKIGLHIHAYYQDQLKDILSRLSLNCTSPDLLISYHGEWHSALLVEEYLEGRDCKVILKELPNRGRDIGPMLTGFRDEIQHYDIIGHLHTKKTENLGHAAMAEHWSVFILENIIGGEFSMLDKIASAFLSDPKLGIVFPDDPNICDWGANKGVAENLLSSLGCPPPREHFFFPVGSMFWCRVRALKPIWNLALTYDGYPDEPLPDDGTILHALERIFPLVAQNEGFSVELTYIDGITR